MSDYFTIGQAARESGFSSPTIRYYEEVGILPQPLRGENGYRLYSRDDLVRLDFVKRARPLGLSLEETKNILAFATDGRCGTLQRHLISLLEAKIAEANERMRALKRLKAELEICHQTITKRSRARLGISPPADPVFCACMDEPVK